MTYRKLEWDTNFFGISVGRIEAPDLDLSELASTLAELKNQSVELVYWSSVRQHDEQRISQLSGTLVDFKTTFVIDLRLHSHDAPSPTEVEALSDSAGMDDLERLAIQSGEYSRFATDPRFPRDKFVDLYRTWITRSVRRENASEVLVVRDRDRIAGMITVGVKEGRGDVGLLAVDRDYRGKGLGEKLVKAALGWFAGQGLERAQVVTQGANVAACNLYRACGYRLERVDFFYHFWL